MRWRQLEFKIDDWVLGKLNRCYIGPYQIMKKFGNVSYDLPVSLALVLPMFHVFMLKKCVDNHSFIVLIENISVKYFLILWVSSYQNIGSPSLKLHTKVIALVKVLGSNQRVEDATLELEKGIKARYPSLSLHLMMLLEVPILCYS